MKAAICENINLYMEKNEEEFRDYLPVSQIEYIRTDMEGSYIAIRRRAACELVKGLSLIIVLKLMVCFQRMCKA